MTETAPRHHGNRWGRSEQARRAVLEAVDDLLAERGFAGVTIEGIAAAAGVAKQTIYRWWDSKTDILMDALLADAEHLTPADRGDVGDDLRDYLGRLADFLTRSAPAVFLRHRRKAPRPRRPPARCVRSVTASAVLW
jgi:AcrR family transcriptional regulator